MDNIRDFLNKLNIDEEIKLEELLFYKKVISSLDDAKFSLYDKEITYDELAEEQVNFYWNLIIKNKKIIHTEDIYYEKVKRFVDIYKLKNKEDKMFLEAKEYIINNMGIKYKLLIIDLAKKIKKEISSIEQDGFFIKKNSVIISSKINFEITYSIELEEKIAQKITSKILKVDPETTLGADLIQTSALKNDIKDNYSKLDEKLSKIRKQISIKENKQINADNIDQILENLLEERDEIHVYDIVRNKKFGNGLVTAVNKNGVCKVYFFEAEIEKNIVESYLERIVLNDSTEEHSKKIQEKKYNIKYKNNNNEFYVGEKVYHDLYGTGIVESVVNDFVKVRFEKNPKTQLILAKILKKVETDELTNVTPKNIKDIDNVLSSLIQDDKEIAYLSGKNLLKYPNSISEGVYTKEEVGVYNYLKKVMSDGMIAFGTNENSITRKIGLIINKNKGVFAYFVMDLTLEKLEDCFEYIQNIIKIYQEQLLNKLLLSKQLFNKLDEYKILKFPFKLGIIFPNIDPNQIKNEKMKNANNIFLKNFMKTDIFSNFDIPYDKNFKELSKSDTTIILERFIPEYTTILFKEKIQISNDYAKVENKDIVLPKITGKEYEYKVLELEEEQIKSINNLKPGVSLTLANPGTGKSVILISNAYRVSKLYNENTLITCYNKNLIEKYKYEYDISGLNTNKIDDNIFNLQISTFDSLLSKIYSDKYDKYFNLTEDVASDAFNDLFEEVYEIVINNEIDEKYKYKAIFIDEIQLFDPKWIDFLYMLLKKDGYFYMYGDINQDVKNSKRKGQASWQKVEKLPNDYKVNYLKRNYRNTIEINEYLNNVLNLLNDTLNFYGMPIKKSDYVLDSTAIRNGKKPQIIEVNNNLAEKVIDVIDELKSIYNISYNDICLVYPNEKYKVLRYYPLLWLTKKFNERGIPFSTIYGNNRCELLETNGITITTIDSSLGLDFKAVILCGLKPLNTYWPYETNSAKFFKSEKIHNNEEALIGLNLNVRKIYTAASRAREKLYILNDLGDESLLNNIIMNKDGEDLYDRR